jgi:hypothetical protein
MAYQAIQSFHTVRGDGTEEFVPKGKVFSDGHPFVKRDETGVLFEKLNLDQDAESASAKPDKAEEPKPAAAKKS